MALKANQRKPLSTIGPEKLIRISKTVQIGRTTVVKSYGHGAPADKHTQNPGHVGNHTSSNLHHRLLKEVCHGAYYYSPNYRNVHALQDFLSFVARPLPQVGIPAAASDIAAFPVSSN